MEEILEARVVAYEGTAPVDMASQEGLEDGRDIRCGQHRGKRERMGVLPCGGDCRLEDEPRQVAVGDWVGRVGMVASAGKPVHPDCDRRDHRHTGTRFGA